VFQLWWAVVGFKLSELPNASSERVRQFAVEMDDLIDHYCRLAGLIRPTCDELFDQADAPGSKFDAFTDMPAWIILSNFWAKYFDAIKDIAPGELMVRAKDVQVRSRALFQKCDTSLN
jgi:hypothetical protein